MSNHIRSTKWIIACTKYYWSYSYMINSVFRPGAPLVLLSQSSSHFPRRCSHAKYPSRQNCHSRNFYVSKAIYWCRKCTLCDRRAKYFTFSHDFMGILRTSFISTHTWAVKHDHTWGVNEKLFKSWHFECDQRLRKCTA